MQKIVVAINPASLNDLQLCLDFFKKIGETDFSLQRDNEEDEEEIPQMWIWLTNEQVAELETIASFDWFEIG
jgi:N-acetylglutamate synthase-like GNAT family acetyltransferase